MRGRALVSLFSPMHNAVHLPSNVAMNICTIIWTRAHWQVAIDSCIGGVLLVTSDAAVVVIMAASQHQQRYRKFSTSGPNHIATAEPSVIPPLDRRFISSWSTVYIPSPSIFPPISKSCKYRRICLCTPVELILLLRAAPQVRRLISISSSTLQVHAFPPDSFWARFGIGSSMVLW
jgi:hypothetical protein